MLLLRVLLLLCPLHGKIVFVANSFVLLVCILSFAGAVQPPFALLFLTLFITSILQIVEKWGGAALRQGSSDEGTYTFSYVSLTLAIFYGAFGGCVWYLHEAIVDAVYVGKDDKTIRGGVSASGSEGDTYASAAETSIRTKEQNNPNASTTVTETTAPKKTMPSLDEDASDGSYELV